MRCLLLLVAGLLFIPASAVFIDFQNCLSESIQNNTPLQLQLVPQYVNAVFNTTDPNHNLRVTVYANVTGSTPTLPRLILPPANDSYWRSNQTDMGGKISDVPNPEAPKPKFTTLFYKVNVLTYTPYIDSADFCDQLENGTCPLAPVFNASG